MKNIYQIIAKTLSLFFLLLSLIGCEESVQTCDTNKGIPYRTETDEYVFSDSTAEYSLKADLYNRLTFLEHVYSWDKQKASNTVIASRYGTGDILVSRDLGKTYACVYSSSNEKWIGCLTTSTGSHILFDDKSKLIYLFDCDWNIISKQKNGAHGWLGNFSIAEFHGTIIYAEYNGDVKQSYVWRSKDDGNSWEKVFTGYGRLSDKHNIWHFHTVQPDPYYPGVWYLSSGDQQDECRVWKSKDDGSNWFEVTDPNPTGVNLQSIHRYTSIHFEPDYIYWATDDITDGSAKFVRVTRSEPLKVEVIADLYNLVRSMVKTPYGYIFITEQKVSYNDKFLDLSIAISPDNSSVIELFSWPSTPAKKTGFTYSRSSIASKGDVFFSYYYGRTFFKYGVGTLKWVINKN